MIPRYRRYWVLPAALVLALPLMVGLVEPDQTVSTNEARQLAPAPVLPVTPAGWLRLPGQVDAYLHDHFGLRGVFIRTYAALMSQSMFRSGNGQVLTGLNGWMFYRGDAMVAQSAGLVRRDQEVSAAADLVAAMNHALDTRGIRLLVASPPNSATIYRDQLPLWAANHGQRTEYDLFLDDLGARGVPAVDLRPALQAAKAEGKAYRLHDTHWTARGALAAFNAIVQVDSHSDWQLDAASVLGPPLTIIGGDLARMLGIEAAVSETDQLLTLPPAERTLFESGQYPIYLATVDRPGPTIMIIGDSFTVDLFAPMLLRHAGQVAWLYHDLCGFDWKWIEQFHPDEVWWMPTERFILCRRGSSPNGLPVRSLAER